jgi:DNA-binding transcriptional ArsR family regulator
VAPERPNAGGRPALEQSVRGEQTSDTLSLAADVSDPEPELDDDPEPDLDDAQLESALVAPQDPGPGGWWQAPRRLRLLLEDREITPMGFALLHYVGSANGDREGCVATKESLAALLDVSKRTIERVLPRLRELGLVTYEMKQGQRDPFRLRLGPAALVAQPPTPPPPPDAPSWRM